MLPSGLSQLCVAYLSRFLIVFCSVFVPGSANGGASVVVDQPDSGGGGVVISVPVKLNLKNGANSITFGAGQSSK